MIQVKTAARIGAVVAAGLMSFGVAAPVHAAGGANNGCGPYCPNGVGQPSGNGNATNQPAAGTVGSADSKFPPGQSPDGTDNNNGYECDGNEGVGQTNPAHSGCSPY